MAKKEENELKKDILEQMKSKVITEVNKEIKNSITSQVAQFKEDFKEQMNRDIEEEIDSILKREEKRMVRSKNFSLFKKNVVILLLFGIVCYFGYCLYDVKYFDFMKSDCEKSGQCTSLDQSAVVNEPEEIIKDKDWYITNYGYLLENAKVSLNADQASAYYLYSKDYKVSEIKPSYLLNMAYKKLNEKEIKTNSVNVTVEEEALKNAFLELFGTLDTYKPTAFSFNCLNFKYEKDHNRYVALQQTCNSNKEILENITDMYEERNQLYILTTATIYDKNESSYYKFDNLFDPILNDVSEKDLTTNNKKLNQYQYIFKKVEDTYYFDSITKLK